MMDTVDWLKQQNCLRLLRPTSGKTLAEMRGMLEADD